MNPSPTVPKIKYVGLDVHAETIAVALADSAGAVRAYGTIPAHTHAVGQLVRKLAEYRRDQLPASAEPRGRTRGSGNIEAGPN